MLFALCTGFTAITQGPVLRFIDPASRSPVVLIGVMHYNPASIALVRSTIQETAATNGGVGAVCVELCHARWNVTVARRWRRGPSLERWLFEDEAQAAFEAAQEAAGLDVVLADQPIADTVARTSAVLRATVADMGSPAGWRCIARDLRVGIACFRAGGDADGLGLRDTLDIALLAGAPIALLRYLSSSPPTAVLLAAALATLDRLLDAVATDDSVIGAPERLLEVALVLAVAAAALRVVLVALIDERNRVIARNVRTAALATGPGEAVVGVLGMAHVNGVRRLLAAGGEGVQGAVR